MPDDPPKENPGKGVGGVLQAMLEAASDLPASSKLVVIVSVGLVALVVFPRLSDNQVLGIVVAILITILVLVVLFIDEIRDLLSPDLEPGGPLTVGVLSFAELGVEDDEEALGDGFAEELITRLSRIETLNVKPRHAMLRMKGSELSARRIARKLRAHYLVEGSLRQHGNELRVTAGVIRVRDGDHWSDSWSGHLDHLFDLQSDVAEGVADHLVGHLSGAEAGPLDGHVRSAVRRNPSGSVPANVAFMRGRANRRRFNNRREEAHFLTAEKAFNNALELDPDYVDAWAELGFLYLLRWETDGASGWLDRAAAAFRQVEHRVPDHPTAVSELGYIALVQGRADEAIELVHRSARRHDHETIPQNVLALAYMYLGFYESAIHVTEWITKLDPDYVYPPTNAATCCILTGRCDEALRWVERAKQIDATAFIVWLVEGTAWFCKGRHGAARKAWTRGLEVAPASIDPLFEVALAWIAADEGDEEAARAVVAEHRHDAWLEGAYDPYFISLCSLAGEHDLAVDLLERQVTWGASYRYLAGDPTLRPLHDHPRFQQLLLLRRDTWKDHVDRIGDQVPEPPADATTGAEWNVAT